ncbi:siderophore-interacting protein [Psychromicrobium sp. YIM B11713]|uniref:siderophore-interacting protein n=1 Tax=Psychromicrobium sp. YIM B11713 TaxID=3145233 RepID=UPI00374F2C00
MSANAEQIEETPLQGGAIRQAPELQPIMAFEVEVARVRSLSPHFKRITFYAEQLRQFGANAEGQTLDLRIKVMIPSAGHPLPDFAALMELPGMSWYQSWLRMDQHSRGFMRTYTVREARRELGEVDVDFVLHPPVNGGPAGPAASWAEQAAVGEKMVLIGPNGLAGPCLGIEFKPGASRRLLLVGDETAVPAIAAIVESLDPETTGTVILEVPDAADFQDFRAPDGVSIQWLSRAGQHGIGEHGAVEHGAVEHGAVEYGAVQHGALLDAAVRAAVLPGSHIAPVELEDVDVDQEILWDTPEDDGAGQAGAAPAERGCAQLYAWIAGEAAVIRELRRYLVRDVGMDRHQVAFMGYWRIGKAES